MIYVLAIPKFKAPQRDRIEAFRKMSEPARAKLVPAHVTFAFALSRTPVDDILNHCEDVAAKTPVFRIEFSHLQAELDPYENAHKVFMMTSVGTDRLMRLHQKLYSGFAKDQFDARQRFQAHMTVATSPEKTIIDALDTSTLGCFPLQGEISSLTVVSFSEGQLKQIGHCPFGR